VASPNTPTTPPAFDKLDRAIVLITELIGALQETNGLLLRTIDRLELAERTGASHEQRIRLLSDRVKDLEDVAAE
jgi:hypothetical protein